MGVSAELDERRGNETQAVRIHHGPRNYAPSPHPTKFGLTFDV